MSLRTGGRKPYLFAALTAVIFASACGTGMSFPNGLSAGGEAGATAGGAKDLNLARSKVDAGTVPAAADFPPEGLYAEHDLPVDGAACTEAFCVRAASAVAPGVEAASDAGEVNVPWLQLGLSSGIDLANFQRPALNLAMVLDISCSMSGPKLEQVKAAAQSAVDHLEATDSISVVIFDDFASVKVAPRLVTDKEAIKATIGGIKLGNSTCIECGLKLGYQQLPKNRGNDRKDRVVLMTDAMPNVGATGDGEFTQLLEAAAADGVGTTVMGVGLDFGQELATKISASRGANYFFLRGQEDADRLFGPDFELWVTPLAYDLKLHFAPADGVSVGAVYGIPGEDVKSPDAEVKTVFLSRQRGAIVARLAGPVAPGAALGTLSLDFEGVDGSAHSSTLEVHAPAETAPAYSSASTRKALALTRFVVSAKNACALFASGDKAGATAESARAADALDAEAQATEDAELAAEVTFARALADVIAAQ